MKKEIRERAQKELNAIKEEANTRVAATDKVNFVVNDDVVYTDIKSFRSDATRQMYYEVMRLQNDSKNKQRTLNTLREKYHNTADNNRTALTRDILQLEQQLDEARQQLKKLEAQLRTAENKLIKK
jgi:predicted nuclease with TOPRIM domain